MQKRSIVSANHNETIFLKREPVSGKDGHDLSQTISMNMFVIKYMRNFVIKTGSLV